MCSTVFIYTVENSLYKNSVCALWMKCCIIYVWCTCVSSIIIVHPRWTMQASRGELKSSPFGQYLWKPVYRYFQAQKRSFKFQMGFWRLVEKEKKQICGRLYTLHPSSSSCSSSFSLFFMSSLLSLSHLLSLLSTFSKSIYILTPGCRGMLSCCYATWMSSRMSEWWQSVNAQ